MGCGRGFLVDEFEDEEYYCCEEDCCIKEERDCVCYSFFEFVCVSDVVVFHEDSFPVYVLVDFFCFGLFVDWIFVDSVFDCSVDLF